MTMREIRDKARRLGIKPRKMKKVELVRSIQKTEGNPDCYGRSLGHCPHMQCDFYQDCLKIKS